MDYSMDFEDSDSDRCGLSDIEITIVNGNPPDWWTRSSNWPPSNGSMSLMTRLRVNYKNLPEELKTNLRGDYPTSSSGPILRVGPTLPLGISCHYSIENDPMRLYRRFPSSDMDSCAQCPAETADSLTATSRNRMLANIAVSNFMDSDFFISTVNSQVHVPVEHDLQQPAGEKASTVTGTAPSDVLEQARPEQNVQRAV